MRLKYIRKPPESCYVALSGGVDSVVLLHSLINRKVKVKILTIDHLDDFSKQEVIFSKQLAEQYNLECIIKQINPVPVKGSLEGNWSKERNRIFQSMDMPVLTGHHLDDAIEWYIMTCMQGNGRSILFNNRNVYRPMLTINKSTIKEYAAKYSLNYLLDPTNGDPDFGLRNKVRYELMPGLIKCFPGIEKVVRKQVLAQFVI